MSEENKGDRKIIEDINTIGWSVIMIEGTDYLPSFAYTIGLWENYKHPEIISFGLTVKTLHLILNDVGESVKKGNLYDSYTSYSDIFTNGDVQLLKVDQRNVQNYFGYAVWFYKGQNFPALQLVWQDRINKFPWEEEYQEEFKYRQPLLDRNAEFKFREEKNVAVFTTRQWTEQNNAILRVVHDEDGDWQFLTGDQMPEDIKIVGLEEMVLRDKTLNEIFDLDYGEAAERHSIADKWKRSKCAQED